jgi:hypothetical protein
MPTPFPDLRNTLLSSIAELDERSRLDRTERVIWLSDQDCLPSAIMGRVETLHLLQAVRAVFVDGHDAATLILALAVVEQPLVEGLQLRKLVTGSQIAIQFIASCAGRTWARGQKYICG